ncbi:MAG: hypothetical protein IID44_28360 [Planctomycetes bacterium]|nr:hypothetical protein [Planctomycetota bacterium]
MDRPSFENSVHVTHGYYSLDSVCKQIAIPNSLMLGPCHRDDRTHQVLRERFWDEFEEQRLSLLSDAQRSWVFSQEGQDQQKASTINADQLRRKVSALPPTTPLVVWSTRAWDDRLYVWWTAAALQCCSSATGRVWLAESRAFEMDNEERIWSLLSHNQNQLDQVLEQAILASGEYLDEASQLWQAYADPSPLEFDRLRRTTSTQFPDLRDVAEPHGYGFPNIDQNARLRLSDLDQFLLGWLSPDKWTRPLDVIIGMMKTDGRMFCAYNESFPAFRLHQWRNHRPERPTIVSEHREGANSLTRITYRLTDHGSGIVHRGLDALDDAPAMHVGGCRVYDPAHPWVRRNGGDGWVIGTM